MYIVIKEEPFKVTTFETKSDLSNYLNLHRNTIEYRFSKSNYWESDKGIVYKANEHFKRVRKGNSDSKEVKIKKRNREIPCKNPKLNISP